MDIRVDDDSRDLGVTWSSVSLGVAIDDAIDDAREFVCTWNSARGFRSRKYRKYALVVSWRKDAFASTASKSGVSAMHV